MSEKLPQPESNYLDREALIEAVKALYLPIGEYAVFGSGPLVVYRLKETRDIDLVVSEDLYQRLKREGWEEKTWGEETYLSYGLFEAIPSLNYPGFAPEVRTLIERSEKIEGVPFVSLSDILAWKQARNSPKDRPDIARLKQLGVV